MAKVYNNDRGFLVIQMNGHEASNIGFGVPITGLLNQICCGTCNDSIEHKNIYYVAGINEVLCEECVEDFVSSMNHYLDNDSLRYEETHFNIIAQRLGMEERARRTHDGKIEVFKP